MKISGEETEEPEEPEEPEKPEKPTVSDNNMIGDKILSSLAGWKDVDAKRVVCEVSDEPEGSGIYASQLVKKDLMIEKGKTYKMSFNVQSTDSRKIQYGVQLDKNPFTPYGISEITVSANEITPVELVFEMKEETDETAACFINFYKSGATGSKTIIFEDIRLVEVEENMLQNADFSNGLDGWTETIANWEAAVAGHEIINGSIKYTIENPGTKDWHVQLKQENLILEAGKTYVVSYDVETTAARTIKSGVQSASYEWYGNADPTLEANNKTTVSFEVEMKKNDSNAVFYISMGKIDGEDTPASDITISNLKFVEKK